MNLNKSILIRVDFNKYIGLGHIKRCINLATIFEKKGWRILFVCKDCEEKNKIDNTKFHFIYLKNTISEEEDGLQTIELYKKYKIKILIIDRDNFLTLNKKRQYYLFLKKVRKANILFSWDPLIYKKFNYDYIYFPYVGAKKIFRINKKSILGENFLIINKKFFFFRKLKSKIKNILINLGGTDKFEYLIEILNMNIFLFNPYKIKIILFNKLNTIQIEEFKRICNLMRSKVDLVINPKMIHNYYKWADLGIVSSGYSKYEASASGLPIFLFESSNLQSKFNNFFLNKKSSFLYKKKNFAHLFNLLQNNFKLRKLMSKNSRKILSINNEKRVLSFFNNIIRKY